jgi:hypothetical protein
MTTRLNNAVMIRSGGSKYHNTKTEIDGITFDSKAEARRYVELVMLERAGEITKLRRQVRYPLMVNDLLVAIYIADFVYFEGGRETVEDCKGFLTSTYRLKKKLMKAVWGIEIREVTQ